MAAVDANCNLIYVNVGTQGRVSDAGLFATSDLKRALDNDLLNIPPPAPLPNSDIQFPFVFVGDEAYPLRLDLMKPFPHRQLEMDQRVFQLPPFEGTKGCRECLWHPCQPVASVQVNNHVITRQSDQINYGSCLPPQFLGRLWI